MSKFDRVLSDDEIDQIVNGLIWASGDSFGFGKDVATHIIQAVLARLHEQEPLAWYVNNDITFDQQTADSWKKNLFIVKPLYENPSPSIVRDKAACVSENAESETQEPTAWLILDSEGNHDDLEPFYHGDTLSMASKFKRPLYAHPTPNRQGSPDSSLTKSGQLDRALVKSLALQSGFKPKEDGELREYVYDFAGKVLGSCKASVDNSGHAEPFTPKTPAEMRSFIGMHFDSLQYANPETEEPDEMDRYTLTIHDLLSAFDWAGYYDFDHVVGNNDMVGSDHIPDIGQMVPEGWQLVPKEPTDAMLSCVMGSVGFGSFTSWYDSASGRYMDMLAAAPKYTGEK